MNPALLALAPVYALADRFAGGGAPDLDARLPGRAAFWGAVLAAGVGFWLARWEGVAWAAAWLAYRTPAWKLIPGSSATPRGLGEAVATFARHAIVGLPALFVAAGFHRDIPLTLGAMAGFALGAALLGCWYARRVDAGGEGQPNTFVELARGALFGVAVAAVLAFA